jgi:hypothetical protein
MRLAGTKNSSAFSKGLEIALKQVIAHLYKGLGRRNCHEVFEIFAIFAVACLDSCSPDNFHARSGEEWLRPFSHGRTGEEVVL